MSPYQRAAAVAVVPRPATDPSVTRAPTGRPRWSGHGDRAVQALLGFSVAVVLAAMACAWLVVLDLSSDGGGGLDEAVRTWALDAVTVLVLGTAGVAHSVVRRGRPGRWPVAVLCVAVTASVVLAPAFVA